jgi:hypothetical protein
MNTASISVGLLVTSALLGLGCAVEAGASEEAPAKAQQAVASFGIWSWGCSSNPCAITLMTAEQGAAQATCFLAGLTGDLQSSGAYSEVLVHKINNQWGLQIVTNDGHQLGGTAVCISTGDQLAETFTLPSGQSQVAIGSGLTRRCFLSGVRTTNGFSSTQDYVHVRPERGTSWVLTSNQSGKDLVAFATCVNVPTAAIEVALTVAGGTFPGPSDIQLNNPPGWACGLTKIGGRFTVDNYGEGTWIDYRTGSSMWQLNVTGGKSAFARCVK